MLEGARGDIELFRQLVHGQTDGKTLLVPKVATTTERKNKMQCEDFPHFRLRTFLRKPFQLVKEVRNGPEPWKFLHSFFEGFSNIYL